MGAFNIDFPTLGDLGDAWITQHLLVPQGFARGRPYKMADWQFWCHANRYRVREDAVFVRPGMWGLIIRLCWGLRFFISGRWWLVLRRRVRGLIRRLR